MSWHAGAEVSGVLWKNIQFHLIGWKKRKKTKNAKKMQQKCHCSKKIENIDFAASEKNISLLPNHISVQSRPLLFLQMAICIM